jgi:hypothetical protein
MLAMPNDCFHRTIIIGNSGAGKTTLATRLAQLTGGRHVALDDIYWDGPAGLIKRVEPAAKQMTAAAAEGPNWVIEGVFGWLVDVASPRATALIWLDLPWADCKAGLEARGPGRSPSPEEYAALLGWAEQYWSRQSSSSAAGHAEIFDTFAGHKRALRSRAEVAAFAARPAADRERA